MPAQKRISHVDMRPFNKPVALTESREEEYVDMCIGGDFKLPYKSLFFTLFPPLYKTL